VSKLKSIGFKQSQIDECVFYQGKCIYVLYTDDLILAGPTNKDLDQAIADMKKAELNLTVEGDIADFLGVKIERKADGTIHFTQPHLIDSILECLRLKEDKGKTKSTPAASSRILGAHKESLPHDDSFNYRQVVERCCASKNQRAQTSHILSTNALALLPTQELNTERRFGGLADI
jgi:hypothetical protein